MPHCPNCNEPVTKANFRELFVDCIIFCAICQADAVYPTSTRCGHVFCGECINKWVDNASQSDDYDNSSQLDEQDDGFALQSVEHGDNSSQTDEQHDDFVSQSVQFPPLQIWQSVSIKVRDDMYWLSDSSADQISLYTGNSSNSPFSILDDSGPSLYGFIPIWNSHMNPPRWSLVPDSTMLSLMGMTAHDVIDCHVLVLQES